MPISTVRPESSLTAVLRGGAAAIALLCATACGKSEPAPKPEPEVGVIPEMQGTLSVGGLPAMLLRCRVGYDESQHLSVEVQTSLGTLSVDKGKLLWNGKQPACEMHHWDWNGGIRSSGGASLEGTVKFSCGSLQGDLKLDCGRITDEELAKLEAMFAATGSGAGSGSAGSGSAGSGSAGSGSAGSGSAGSGSSRVGSGR